MDKTFLIQEIVEKGTHVALIPRLRRFGKTLNLSMLRYFFEKGEENTSDLFKSLNIWKNEKYRAMQGQFPVIFISLKDVKHSSWQETFESLCRIIAKEFERHRFLLEGELLSSKEKDIYNTILSEEGSKILLEQSLLFLTEWLHRYHKKRVVLLIDEYDTPAHAAYVGKYYDILIAFFEKLVFSRFKRQYLFRTGSVHRNFTHCKRRTYFSGLNNISTFTIMNEAFNDKFGLLESEVHRLLEDYSLSEKLPEIRKWYDGYRIGSCNEIIILGPF